MVLNDLLKILSFRVFDIPHKKFGQKCPLSLRTYQELFRVRAQKNTNKDGSRRKSARRERNWGKFFARKKAQSPWENSFFREKIKTVNFVFQLRNWQSCFQFLWRERRGFSSENIAKTRSKFIPQFELCKIAPFLSFFPNLDGKRRHIAMLHTHCWVSLYAAFGNTNWLKMATSSRPFLTAKWGLKTRLVLLLLVWASRDGFEKRIKFPKRRIWIRLRFS